MSAHMLAVKHHSLLLDSLQTKIKDLETDNSKKATKIEELEETTLKMGSEIEDLQKKISDLQGSHGMKCLNSSRFPKIPNRGSFWDTPDLLQFDRRPRI